MPRKPRADSKLKTLPPDQQTAVMEILRAHTIRKAVKIVRDQLGIETSAGALSGFFKWYPLSRQIDLAAEFAERLEADLKANPNIKAKAEDIAEMAQIAFEARALEQGDAELYLALKKRRQKDVDQEITRESLGLRIRQYEDRMRSIRDSLEKAKSKGGISAETLQEIEQQVALL